MAHPSLRRKLIALGGLVAVGALVASCAATSEPDTPSEQSAGIPVGATKAEYQKAFADLDPIELVFQTGAGAGSALADRDRAYVDAVDEWSGGKVKIRLAFAGEIAPPAETIAAMQDGRIDLTHALPQYYPEDFPVYNEWLNSTVLSQTEYLVADLQTPILGQELFNNTPQLVDEFTENGFRALAFNPGFSGFWCTEPLTTADDFRGKIVAVGTSVAAQFVTAIGASPTTLPFSEYYEGLQRGVVNCVITGPETAQLVGLIEVAPYLTTWPTGVMVHSQSPFAISTMAWDRLPLVAQQLLFDRLDAYLSGAAAVNISAWEDAADSLRAAGGKVSALDDELVDVGRELVDDAVLPAMRSSTLLDGETLYKTATAAADRTNTETRGFLGIGDDEVGFLEIGEWMDENDPDITAFIQEQLTGPLGGSRPE